MIYDKAYYEAQGYRFFSGHTFKYFENGVSWKKAKAACEALGGHLATSTSAEKNEFLTTLVINNAWLGGTKVVTEDTWTWITGEEWIYTNWDVAHSGNASDEHYLELELSGKWNDFVATETLFYICEWDDDFCLNGVEEAVVNHEGTINLEGGSEGEHYHLTEDELIKLQKVLDLLFPDGATEPVIPTPHSEDEEYGSQGELFGGLPNVIPPEWTNVRLPNYSTKVQYSCYNAVHSMYYGKSAGKKGTTPKTGLHVLLEYGSKTNCYMVFTQDLETWSRKHNFHKLKEADEGISQYMYINTGNTSSTYQHRLYMTLPGRDSKSNMIRFFYGEGTSGTCSEHYISQSNVGSKVAYTGCCYSEKQKMYIFVSKDGHVARVDASTPKSHKVLAKENDNNCGIDVNPGCVAWSSYANVFCATGPQGIATSADAKGAWIVNKNAPKNLVDLVYREDLPSSQPKGFFARSADDKCFYASVDGVEWFKVSTTPIPLEEVAAVDYNPDLGWYCAIGGKSQHALFSKDLVHWVKSQVSSSPIDMGSVIWMHNTQKYVLMPKSGSMFYTFSPSEWIENAIGNA